MQLDSGKLLIQRKLRTDASYRVVKADVERVLVEVVSAPGLLPGSRFVISRPAAEAMLPADGRARVPLLRQRLRANGMRPTSLKPLARLGQVGSQAH